MPNPEQPQLMQEKIADIKEPQQDVAGLEIAETPELEKVVDAANNLSEKIEKNENVTARDVLDLEEASGQIKIDFYGKKITLEEIRKIPNLKENKRLWDDIMSGNYHDGGLDDLTFLPEKVAEAASKFEGTFTLSFYRLDSLSSEIAEALSKWKGQYLLLDGITSLSKKEAKALSNFEGKKISLMSLTSLSDEAAQELSNFNGDIVNCKREIKSKIDEFKAKE